MLNEVPVVEHDRIVNYNIAAKPQAPKLLMELHYHSVACGLDVMWPELTILQICTDVISLRYEKMIQSNCVSTSIFF